MYAKPLEKPAPGELLCGATAVRAADRVWPRSSDVRKRKHGEALVRRLLLLALPSRRAPLCPRTAGCSGHSKYVTAAREEEIAAEPPAKISCEGSSVRTRIPFQNSKSTFSRGQNRARTVFEAIKASGLSGLVGLRCSLPWGVSLGVRCAVSKAACNFRCEGGNRFQVEDQRPTRYSSATGATPSPLPLCQRGLWNLLAHHPRAEKCALRGGSQGAGRGAERAGPGPSLGALPPPARGGRAPSKLEPARPALHREGGGSSAQEAAAPRRSLENVAKGVPQGVCPQWEDILLCLTLPHLQKVPWALRQSAVPGTLAFSFALKLDCLTAQLPRFPHR
ncbi:uncharacterized protein LOC135177791 [Pogoniulus pusillus]|uniref:uncharacterized protein LOC135177791 n=1 Tax=Pogoniulus pusillus TaxID=488313 RepID=UPI0030B928C7